MNNPGSFFVKAVSVLALVGISLGAWADSPLMGIVVMHGKGGSPTKHVDGLASELKAKGFLVANLEMPWSGRREYDVDVGRAEAEVESALAEMRKQGANKLFVAGHSQGGAFALHFAGKHMLDGVIAIAPGGNVANNLYREKLGEAVATARQLVAAGKGDEKARFEDYEGSKGTFPVMTTAATYLSWFDPEGAMNMQRAARAANPQTPILWIVAQRDYPGLRKVNIPMFSTLPANPKTRLFEPNSDHLGAPAASSEEIAGWVVAIANPQ